MSKDSASEALKIYITKVIHNGTLIMHALGPEKLRRRYTEVDHIPIWPDGNNCLEDPADKSKLLLIILSWRLRFARPGNKESLLKMMMRNGYAFDFNWRPDFSDASITNNPEVVKYIFAFPFLIGSENRHAKMEKYYWNLFADLDDLYSSSKSAALKKVIAREFTNNFSYISMLFTDLNLLHFAKTSAKWIEYFLSSEGNCLGHNFSMIDKSKRLRVGMFVDNLNDRNESFISLSFVRYLDPLLFERILIVQHAPPATKFGKFGIECFDRVFVLGAGSIKEKVDAIREVEIDILIFGNYFAAFNCEMIQILAHRVSRIHALAVAISPSTTGLSQTDIVLTASNTEPSEAATSQYSERIKWLSGTFNCFSFGPSDPRIMASDEEYQWSFPRRQVLVSGGVIYKLVPTFRKSLIRILRSLPSSCLVLYPFNPNWGFQERIVQASESLYQEFSREGIDRDRITIMSALKPFEIYHILTEATLYLDTFPFSGGASLVEPVLAACPIVTLAGRTQRGLLGSGTLRSLGLASFVAESIDEYEKKAVDIVTSAELRKKMSEQLKEAAQNAAFLDAEIFGQQLSITIHDLFDKSLIGH